MEWTVLASVPGPDRQRLLAELSRQAYRRDEVIFHQGDPADTLHLIASGHVSVRVTLAGGEFVVVAILGPGESFGELGLVSDSRTRGATVTAMEGCETMRLRRNQFEALRSAYPQIDRFLTELLAARVDRLNHQLLEALYLPAERRVLRRLADLCELYAGDSPHIVVPLTQEMLASLAGTTRPTANQVLGRLVARRVAQVKRGQIVVVNRSALDRQAARVSAR